MSEADVSLIRDEDLLRRMWQQTEDFSRKKEIRAHMYRLREERLRNLYSPEPTLEGKGKEYMAAQDHVKSFADQSFQSMKSKEVRDAGSPPKEFNYRGQDLKALSNAGWNVEQENKTTDDGHTHVKSINANIEGRYDVDGGKGQFAAIDQHKEAITEYHDDNSSLKRNEMSSNTAAREHVVRQTDDGTQISSTTSSSSSTSKFQQMSSTKHESVPYVTNDDYDLRSYDTNRNEDASVTRRQITKTNDYEQNVRSDDYEQSLRKNEYKQTTRQNDFETGELISRKVDYPDNNTKVIVETRCLPDGTRVTSTKREFRVPAQSTQSEQSFQMRSENKSSSTHQRSTSRDSSSKIIRHVIDNRENRTTGIVDSQKNVDDHDFNRQISDYTTKNTDNYSDVKHIDTKVNKTKIDDDYSNIRNVTKINKTVDNTEVDDSYSNVRRYHTTSKKQVDHSDTVSDYSKVHEVKTDQRKMKIDDDNHTTQFTTKTQKVIKSTDNSDYVQTHRDNQHRRYDDRREVITSRGDQSEDHEVITQTKNYQPRDSKARDSDEKIHYVTKDNKVEDIVEKKTNTEQYQTTYQSDFNQKKISTDWSPTHTAWASTLRADTPSTTRPSTRASSPGSKTFKSSTSSLRSSVSPDKTYRNPSSRGNSPTKYNRSSPTRTVSDKYSTVHSTHSVTETKSHKYSPAEDRRPPTGRSPTRPGYSPERKNQDTHQRSSVSPDKRPQDSPYRSSASPDRKPAQKNPTDNYPRTVSPTRRDTPTRPRESPERKFAQQPPTVAGYPSSPNRSSISPEKIPNDHPKNYSPDRKSTQQKPKDERPDSFSNRPRTASSPDCKPGFPASPVADKPDKESDLTPKRGSVSPSRKPGNMQPTSSNQPSDNLGSPKVPTSPSKHTSSPSPTRKPQDYTTSKSKIKEDHYKFIDEETKMYTRTDKVQIDSDKHSKPTPQYPTQKDKTPDNTDKINTVLPDDKTKIPREQSPSKFGTYDKKKPYTETTEEVITTTETKDVKFDTLSNDKKSTNKTTVQRASPTKEISPNKKAPRGSVSPSKSPTKDIKYKQTTDFIATEKTTEEIMKKSRQLVTPSSSPTRKPKMPTDTEPSTGQSSPTTSVSGFVYFSSPRTEKEVVTDLDDQETETHIIDNTNYKRPESLEVKIAPTPSKIPCRSPSPEKQTSPTKESLPRKSSLKKTSTEITPASPIEKPPTSFRVSPTEETKEFTDHKVVKKDRPDTKTPTKVKPPLERRETYEDRCRKILGMIDDKAETTKKQTSFLKEPETLISSPCRSPAPKEGPFEYPSTKKITQTNVDVTDFITHEQEDNVKTSSNRRDDKVIADTPKTPRDGSPTKLQSITKDKTIVTSSITTDVIKETDINKTNDTKHSSPRQSPERKPTTVLSTKTVKTNDRTEPSDYQKPNKTERNRSTSPAKLHPGSSPRSSQSPEKKSLPKEKLPSEDSKNETRDYLETTTTISSEYDETKDTEMITVTTNANIKRSSASPTRKPSDKKSQKNIEHPKKPEANYPRETSPNRPTYLESTTSMVAEYGSSENISEQVLKTGTDTFEHTSSQPSKSATRKPSHDSSNKSPIRKPNSTSKPLTSRDHTSPTRSVPVKESHDSSPTRNTPSKIPGYMKTTESVSSKHDTITSEDVEDIITSKTIERHHYSRQSESPKRTIRKPDEDSRPSSPSQPRITNKSPQRKPSHESSPTRTTTKKQTPDNIPHYMKPLSPHRHVHETEITNEYETTVEHSSALRSHSPTHENQTQETPHYMTPLSHHVHETVSSTIDERESHTHENMSRKISAEEIPHYMLPTSSHLQKHQTEVIEDELETHESTALYSSPRSHSPTRHPQTQDMPHYMTPITRHIHETVTTTEVENETSKFTHASLTSKTHTDKEPHYMTPTTASHLHKHDIMTTEDEFETCRGFDSSVIHSSDSTPTRQSPERKPYPQSSELRKKPVEKEQSPSRQTKKTKTSEEDYEETSVTKTIHNKHSTSKTSDSQTRKTPNRDESPKKPFDKDSSPERAKNTDKKPAEKYSPSRSNTSPERKPGYMKSTATEMTSKQEKITTEEVKTNKFTDKRSSSRSSVSPPRRSPDESSRIGKPGSLKAPEESRQLRTPSPAKKTSKVTEISTDFLTSEREQEILDRVQKSLRKLSPDRKEKSPSRERSPGKTTTSLQDIDISTHTTEDDDTIVEEVTDITNKFATKVDVNRSSKRVDEKPKTQVKVPSKPSSRTVSPTKKPSGIASPSKIDKSPESQTHPRSISPKKPAAPIERPQSPRVSRVSGIKPKENLTRKPTPATLNIVKIDKTSDFKKTNIAKQNNVSKTTTKSIPSPTGKPNELKSPTKGIKESGIPKKESEIKVTRTTSDITIKTRSNLPSPQRMKSKPEIQVSDMSTSKTTNKSQKSSLREPQSKLPGKPKSATTLNTSSDDDDIIIDVQQSKSSRENSPDRICPTPVNFGDDDGTPRYPDEVREPDDEFRRRTYHTIHETESIVDDIVEISEEDELFVRKSDIEHLAEEDESLLSVTDKVTKFTKGFDTVTKPKDSTTIFHDTEKRVHSDFVEKNLKSDECLLSVSEKVNKFAKGPSTNDKNRNRSFENEYDKDTVYTDDYTKLSVHDKAHLFVETAENVKAPKVKPAPQKVERPDLTNVDEALKTDDCLLSVSDKVNKFVKTAEQFITETHETEEKETKIKEQHEKIMKKIIDDVDDDINEEERRTDVEIICEKSSNNISDKPSFANDRQLSQPKTRGSPKQKPTERPPTVKITTLRSSEAVKKAKALFENIATTTQKTKETTQSKKSTKLTDIGVTKIASTTNVASDLQPSVEDGITDVDGEVSTHVPKERPLNGTPARTLPVCADDKPRASPSRLNVQSPNGRRSKSPMHHTVETTTTTIKTTMTKQPVQQRPESPMYRPDADKADRVPGYLRSTKASQTKEDVKIVEDIEVSSRRGSGKFGVELRRLSVERSTVSSERRRSVEHPCIEDIFDLDLLEQMLEKVVGYEQRRRIRAQIRVARKKPETDRVGPTTPSRITKQSVTTPTHERQKTKSPERAPKTVLHKTSSPDRHTKMSQKTVSERSQPKEIVQPVLNGHGKESSKITNEKYTRPQSPEKPAPKTVSQTKTPIRQASPDKKVRPQSPTKIVSSKPKGNRFNEYASAYMKKVGLNEADKLKFTQSKKNMTEDKQKTVKQKVEHKTVEEYTTAAKITERTSSKEIIQVNGNKRSTSPEKRLSPERKTQSPERLHRRSPSPVQKQPAPHIKSETSKKETIIKTVYDIEKRLPQKQVHEEKPSWITNRNLKKISSESKNLSNKIEKKVEKTKYRATSPSKAITKPIDVITSSYGPGPMDADGKPLFGIRALRNGASNFQVKGTVIRQEYHSRNGGEPEGSVSVTAYSTEPEDLERLLQRQGEPPSRIHGLAAITTTKKFGGDTGTTLKEIHGKEERAVIDQFTHSDRRVSDSRVEDITENFIRQEIGETRSAKREDILEDRISKSEMQRTDKIAKRMEKSDERMVRQSSVKSLTEKYIKSANESSKIERTSYPKAGLILRTTGMKDSVSSDSSAHAGLNRTDSEHSLGSVEDTVVTMERCEGGMKTVTTTRTHGHHDSRTEKSFLDSNTKVTGVQDILSRMKNADLVIQDDDSADDTEARALLNKFLGATVLMTGMQSYVTEKPTGKVVVKQETVRTTSSGGGKVTSSQTRSVKEFDIEQCWDERILRQLLDESNDYEQRRRLRARIRTLMAEQEACASAVTEALVAAGEAPEENSEAREEEEVTVTSSVRRNSSEKTVSSSTTTTKTSKVIESMTRPAPKPVSPFAKFRQLEKQNSTNSPKM